MVPSSLSRIQPSLILFCLIVCLLAYGGNAWYPTFNADDIIQAQSASGDSTTFMGQGRWGYYLIFHFLQGENPAGIFSLFIGVSLTFVSALIAADAIGFTKQSTILLFSMVASVSIYYGHLFVFDSVWIAYPIGMILASISANLIIKQKHQIVAVILLSASPAFYQPCIQVFVAILLSREIIIIPTSGVIASLRRLITGALVLSISMLIYFASVKVSPSLSGIPLLDRGEINIVGALLSYNRLIDLFVNQSIPFRAGIKEYYFPWAFRLIIGISFFTCLLLFMTVCYKRKARIEEAIYGVFLLFSLSVVPFLLALASPLDQFGPRSLIIFSTVHAFYICSCLHWMGVDQSIASQSARKTISAGVFLLGACLVLVSGAQSSKLSFDNTLAWQQDRLAVNRMIMRVDDVIQDTEFALQPTLKIAVRFDHPVNSGPRGEILSARYSSWSKEWVFRLLDSRFVAAPIAERSAVIERSYGKPLWPSRGSVYLDEGIVVIVVN
ncbi:glucosyltransferase domain-containing protein [Brucella sp.]|uniref:glucosyltransferase domain-containing protein n=1 Tax=Brucella sp. TaxID=52132 RepID=UPI0028B0C5CC|nr:glucosyltransferase domain-containing protein [Brucella sp.]